MPVVKKSNLQDIYNMWNNTFPNQIANEIEVIFTNKDNGDLRQRFHVEPSRDNEGKWDRPENLRRVNEPRPRNSPVNSIGNGSNKETRNRFRKFRKYKNARTMEDLKEMQVAKKGNQLGEKCIE